MQQLEIDDKTGNLIISERGGYKKTHLNIKTALVEDFRLKIAVNDFQINRTRSLKDKSWENLELKITNPDLVSRVRDLRTNKDISCIDLQIQVDNKYDEIVFYMSFKTEINTFYETETNKIKLNIILVDNSIIKKLLEILEKNNRPSILNIEVNLQGIKGLYPVIASYDNVVSKEIQPEFDIGVLYDHSVIELNRELKESITTYHNDHLSIHSGDHISFFITDTINNES